MKTATCRDLRRADFGYDYNSEVETFFIEVHRMTNPWNNFYEVVCIFVLWTATLAMVMKGKAILWDYEAYPEDSEPRKHA